MQPSIATACLSGSLSGNLRSVACAGLHHVGLLENDILPVSGDPPDGLQRIAAGFTTAFASAKVTWRPRALRP